MNKPCPKCCFSQSYISNYEGYYFRVCKSCQFSTGGHFSPSKATIEWNDRRHSLDLTLQESGGFYVRTRQALKRAGIFTLRDLTSMSAADLMKVKGFGEVALENIRECLSEKGYRLKGDK